MKVDLLSYKYPRGRYYLKNRQLFWYSIKALVKVKFLERNTNPRQALIDFFKKLYGMSYGITCSSCRMALYHILQSLNLNPEDEIILTPITIPDIMNMIALSKIKAQFVDIDIKDHCITLESLNSKINPKTKVMLVTHISGIAQDMAAIKFLCHEKGIVLIEDVSQAHGSKSVDGHPLGSYGDYTIISLTVGKAISSFVGGVLLCRTSEGYRAINEVVKNLLVGKTTPLVTLLSRIWDSFKVAFFTQSYIFSYLTFYAIQIFSRLNLIDYEEIHKGKKNIHRIESDIFLYDLSYRRDKLPANLFFDVSSWQAAFALEMSKQLEKNLKERKDKAIYFINQLNEATKKCLSLNTNHLDNHNYYHIPVYIDTTARLNILKNFLLQNGVDTGGYSLSLCSSLKEFSEFSQDLAGAQSIYENCFFIPVDETLSLKNIRKLATIFNRGIIENS